MTDLEITKKCAEKMGMRDIHVDADSDDSYDMAGRRPYDPLHDDAQAMALVKKLNIQIHWHGFAGAPLKLVTVSGKMEPYGTVTEVRNEDLNRAICECVARMP